MTATRTAKSDVGKPRLLVWFAILMFSSVGMILFNKLAMHSFRFPLSLLFFQNGLSCVLNIAAMHAGLLDGGNAFRAKEARHFVVPALLFAIMLGASLKALPLVTVTSVIVFKNGSTILVAIGDMLVFRQRFHRHAYFGLAIMLCGAVVYGLGDHRYDATGYAWLTLNMVANAVLNIYERYAVVNSGTSPAVCSTYINALSLPFVAAAAVYQQETIDVFTQLAATTITMRACIFVTGCLGFSISLAYVTLFTITSATSIVVASNVNKIVSMALGFLIFRNIPTSQGVVGIVACLYGAWLFATSKKKKVDADNGGSGSETAADDDGGGDVLLERQGLLQSKGVGEDIDIDEMDGGERANRDPAAVDAV